MYIVRIHPGARDARRVTDRDYGSSIGGAVLRGALRGLYLLLDISPPRRAARVCRVCLRFSSGELSDLRSPASASFLPSTLRVASRRSVMPLLDLISLSFSSSLSLFLFLFPFSLFLSPFSCPCLFFSFFISASRPASLCLPRDIAVRCTMSSSTSRLFFRLFSDERGCSPMLRPVLFARFDRAFFFSFLLLLRLPQRIPKFLAEVTVPATRFVVHHGASPLPSSSPLRSLIARATERFMLASTAAPWQHPVRSYHVRRRPVTHGRVRFIH